jgi:hypothetical protein
VKNEEGGNHDEKEKGQRRGGRRRGIDHGYIALVPLDSHWLALRLVEYGGKVLFGVGCRDGLHEFNLSENVHFVYNSQIRQ